MMNNVTCFKIRIDRVDNYKVHFELFVGDRFNDTFVDMNVKGGYGSAENLAMEHPQFVAFVDRLFAYIYLNKNIYKDKDSFTYKKLSELNLNIYDGEVPKLSKVVIGPSLKD